MKRIRGYKVELELNNKQRSACVKHAGVARFAYNWGLQRRNERYKATGISLNPNLFLLWEKATSRFAAKE